MTRPSVDLSYRSAIAPSTKQTSVDPLSSNTRRRRSLVARQPVEQEQKILCQPSLIPVMVVSKVCACMHVVWSTASASPGTGLASSAGRLLGFQRMARGVPSPRTKGHGPAGKCGTLLSRVPTEPLAALNRQTRRCCEGSPALQEQGQPCGNSCRLQ